MYATGYFPPRYFGERYYPSAGADQGDLLVHYDEEIYLAVHQRLTSDASLAQLVDAVSSYQVPDGTSRYVLVTIQSASREGDSPEPFRTLTREVSIIVTCVVPRVTGDSVSPVRLLGQIVQRVEGNWFAQPFGTQPQYGIERWAPSLSTWTAGPLEFERATDDGDNRNIAKILEYTSLITREAV